MDGKPGACGFVSVIVRHILPVYLIKVNQETGEPVRDNNGLCVMCEPGEWVVINLFSLESNVTRYIFIYLFIY